MGGWVGMIGKPLWSPPFLLPFLTLFCFTSANKSPRRNVNCRLVWFQFSLENLFFNQMNFHKRKTKQKKVTINRLEDEIILHVVWLIFASELFPFFFLLLLFMLLLYNISTSLVILFYVYILPLFKTSLTLSMRCVPALKTWNEQQRKKRKQTQLF